MPRSPILSRPIQGMVQRYPPSLHHSSSGPIGIQTQIILPPPPSGHYKIQMIGHPAHMYNLSSGRHRPLQDTVLKIRHQAYIRPLAVSRPRQVQRIRPPAIRCVAVRYEGYASKHPPFLSSAAEAASRYMYRTIQYTIEDKPPGTGSYLYCSTGKVQYINICLGLDSELIDWIILASLPLRHLGYY
jgi:hypothetical protein